MNQRSETNSQSSNVQQITLVGAQPAQQAYQVQFLPFSGGSGGSGSIGRSQSGQPLVLQLPQGANAVQLQSPNTNGPFQIIQLDQK